MYICCLHTSVFHVISDCINRAGTRTLIGGGGCIFIYSGYARLISFEINFITKVTSQTEPEYMNIHTPISVLAPALYIKSTLTVSNECVC